MSTIADLGDLAARQIDHDRLLAAEGAGHIVHDLPLRADGRMVALESRPWRLDPIPMVLDGDEFVALADGAIARMQMLESILGDLYGPRTLLTDAIVDPLRLWGSPKYRLAAFGTRPHRRWLTNYAVDVIRDATGRWRVVRDLTDAPAGVGYSLLARSVSGRVHRDVISAPLPGSGAAIARSVRRSTPGRPRRRRPHEEPAHRGAVGWSGPCVLRRTVVPRHPVGVEPRGRRRPRRAPAPGVAAVAGRSGTGGCAVPTVGGRPRRSDGGQCGGERGCPRTAARGADASGEPRQRARQRGARGSRAGGVLGCGRRVADRA